MKRGIISRPMEKTMRFFKSFAEAEEADKKFYQSLTPAQRIEILLILRSRYQSTDATRERLKRVCRIIKRST
jgi:hypothetical protein